MVRANPHMPERYPTSCSSQQMRRRKGGPESSSSARVSTLQQLLEIADKILHVFAPNTLFLREASISRGKVETWCWFFTFYSFVGATQLPNQDTEACYYV